MTVGNQHHKDLRLLFAESSQQHEELPGDLPSLSWLTTVDVSTLQQRANRLTSITGPQGSTLEPHTDERMSMNTAQEHDIVTCPYGDMQNSHIGMNSHNTTGDMRGYPEYQSSSDPYHLSGQHVFSPAQTAQQCSPTTFYKSHSTQSYEQHNTISPYSHQEHRQAFPKPIYSYSCLIAMALKNSQTGSLPVSEIYSFMKEHFPYFQMAPEGWKNSVRHNLSMNKCFQKMEIKKGSSHKGCLWSLNPAKMDKMEEEMQKWQRKDPSAIRKSMANPDELDKLITDRPEGCQRRSCWDPRMACLPRAPPVSGHLRPLTGTSLHLQAQTGLEPGSPVPAQTPPLHLVLDFSHSPLPHQNPYQTTHNLHNHHPDFTVEVDTSFIEFSGGLWEEMREEGYNLEMMETVGIFNPIFSPALTSGQEHLEDLYTTYTTLDSAVPSQYVTTQDRGKLIALL